MTDHPSANLQSSAATGGDTKPAKPDEFVLAVAFEDKASYTANADDPEQHAWFMKVRELLESDPEWEDGEYVAGGLS